jgi:hypothetical protein
LNSWLALSFRTSEIADPYLRFRARWRFLGSVAEEDDPMEMDVLQLFQQIADPHEKVRAFEWILMTIPAEGILLVDQIGLFDPMMRILSRIADPERNAGWHSLTQNT